MEVKHKILKVPDSVCFDCGQNYCGECRAYCISHSVKETQHRVKFPMLNCIYVKGKE